MSTTIKFKKKRYKRRVIKIENYPAAYQEAQRIAEVCNIELSDMLSKSRKREYTEPRQILMFNLIRNFKYSCTVVGDLVNRTHANVLHGVKVVDNLIEKKGFSIKRWQVNKLLGKKANEVK
jgi:chromosomal replication initiation ATPase DnaA